MKMFSRLSGAALLLFGLCWPATAQIGPRGGGALVVAVCGTLPLAYKPGAVVTPTQDINGNACIAGTFSATGGTISNATSAQATSGTNQGSVSYNYGFNGTTWDQLQVDASKNLNINCQAGCAGGATSNAGSGVATSSTNGKTVNYNYGWNGTTWDQLSSLTVGSKHSLTAAIVDGSGNQITTFGGPITSWAGGTLGAMANYGTSPGAVLVPGMNAYITGGTGVGVTGTFWQTTQPVSLTSTTLTGTLPAYAATPTFNCGTGCGAGGSTSNASSNVATSSTNGPTVSYNYGFNGTSWDQLQVDSSKYLKINCVTGCAGGSGGTSAVDEAAFTWGSPTTYTPIGGVFQTTATSNALSNGQAGAWQMTANRAGFVNMRSASGTEEGTSSNPLYIDTPAGGNLFGAVSGSIASGSNLIGGTYLVDSGGIQTATVKPASTVAAKTDTSVVVQINPLSAGYPAGAVPITASATGTTAATTATLAGTSGKTTYICGYSIRANATAAATVTNTITGVITATMSSIMWVAPAASGVGVDEQIFSPCIPASAANTAIAIVSGTPGTGGNVSSKGWGYQL